MAHVEYEEEGWFSRIGDSIKGIFGGIAIFMLAFPLIFWNECRAVDRAQDLELGLGSVVTAKADSIDKGNEGKLVHVQGDVKVDEKLEDKQFMISANGLALERKVEMYQWKENVKKESKKKAGGKKVTKKTYTYEKTWSSSEIKSSNFDDNKEAKGKVNPGPLPYENKTVAAKSATLGKYKLSQGITSGLGESSKLTLKEADLKKMEKSLKDAKAKIHDGGLYLGKNPAKPEIGDVRITFTLKKPGTATVIAGQYGSELKAWKHKKLNDPLVLTANGKKTPEKMFENAVSSNNMLTWILRFVTWFMMFGGLSAVFRPLSVIADVIPFVGGLVGKAFALVSFLIATPIWFLCVALAWVVARPLLGILMLLGAGLLFGGLIFAAMKARSASSTA
jgi:hypothetical protein